MAGPVMIGKELGHYRILEKHIPLKNQDVIREMLDWLDRYLGPVKLAKPVAEEERG